MQSKLSVLASGGRILNFFGATGGGRNFTGGRGPLAPLEPPLISSKVFCDNSRIINAIIVTQ